MNIQYNIILHSYELLLRCGEREFHIIAVTRYSFIYLIEVEQCGINEIAQASKRQQRDSNPGSLD